MTVPVKRVVILCVLYLFYERVSGGILETPSVSTEANNEEVLKKFDSIDKKIRNAVNMAIEQILPMAVRSSSDVNISVECQGSFMNLVLDLKNMKEWALKMVDASGKIPSGVLTGTIGELGNYDECLGIEKYNSYSKKLSLRGRYCIVEMRNPVPPEPKKMNLLKPIEPFVNFTSDNFVVETMAKFAHAAYAGGYAMGACVPSTCSKEDVQNLATLAGAQLDFYAKVLMCEVKEPTKIDSLQCGLIGTFAVFVLLCIIGTIVDVLLKRLDQKAFKETKEISLLRRVVTSFSFEKNVQTLLKIDKNNKNNELRCIHGLRFFTILWVLLGHTYVFQVVHRNRNTFTVLNWMSNISFQLILSGVNSMQTFICVGGLVMSYTAVSKNTNRNMHMIMIRRILRLLPGLFMIIGVAVMMPLIGNGPMYNIMFEDYAINCRERWYYSALFINNFGDPVKMCWSHLWYLAVDMQCHLVAFIVLIIYFKKRVWSIGISIVLILASILTTSGITYWKDLRALMNPAEIAKKVIFEFLTYLYQMPSTYLASYMIGFLTGAFMAKRQNVELNYVYVILGWSLTTCFCLMNIFMPYEWTFVREATLLENLIYAGFHRPLWGLGISWIVFACVYGYGGYVNRILSFKGLIPLSRLTYMVYLVHFVVMFYYIGTSRDGIYITHVNMVWIFLGSSVVSFIVAFVIQMVFDGPIAIMGNMLIAKPTSAKKGTSPQQENKMFHLPKKDMEDMTVDRRIEGKFLQHL